ncbi:MAG: 4Fe-4S binding protein [Oligoflexia bacterium]|nr:4Fe-4S binding protein [Oligoflexia bacterium]
MSVVVDKRKCPQNHKCPAIKVCPVGALTQEGIGLPQVDDQKCIDCYKCVEFCPMGALQQSEKNEGNRK